MNVIYFRENENISIHSDSLYPGPSYLFNDGPKQLEMLYFELSNSYFQKLYYGNSIASVFVDRGHS